jgi:hypothetical protein
MARQTHTGNATMFQRTLAGFLTIAAMTALGCNDTAKAVKERTEDEALKAQQAAARAGQKAEQSAKEVKEDIDRAAEKAEQAAAKAGQETKQAVDNVDKAVANEIRKGDDKEKKK